MPSDPIWALKHVFSKPRSLVGAIFGAAAFMLFALGLASSKLIAFIAGSPVFPAWEKVTLSVKAMFGALAVTPAPELAIIVLTSALFGANVAMTAHYVKDRVALRRSAGASFIATVFGVLGVGCAACGSVLLSSILGSAAAIGVLSFLPLRGLEFGIIGTVVMSAALWYTARKVSMPDACPVPARR
jgi:hypothetical protein